MPRDVPPTHHTDPTRPPSGLVVALALTSLAAAAVTVMIQLGIAGDIDIGGKHLQLHRVTRPFAICLIATLFLLVTVRRQRRWRSAAGLLCGLYAVLTLAVVAGSGEPAWRTSDGAIIELYVRRATHLRQFLGPYSQ
jgi:hypothetical protein